MESPDDRDPGGRSVVFITLAALVLVVLVGAAILLHQRRPAVLLIGDSITEGGASALEGGLNDSYSVHVDGRGGYRVGEMIPAAQTASAFPFEQVVINLGTNDVLADDQDLDLSLAGMAEIVARFPNAECIHLVTVNEQMFSFAVDAPARARRFNDGLRRLAERDERIDVIDWAEIVDETETSGAEVTTDSVHPNDLGNELLVDAYLQSLQRCS